MKMEPIVSSETSAIRIQTPGNYPKRNKLHLEHGESLKTGMVILFTNILMVIIVNFFNMVTFTLVNNALSVIKFAFLAEVTNIYRLVR